MNFMGKTTTGGDSGSSTSSRRQHHHQQGGGGGGGNSFEDEDEEERQNTAGPTGQLFPSSSSSSPSSSHHQNQNQHQHQPPSFHPQPPYHSRGGGWMHGGEPSSRLSGDPMMLDNCSTVVPVTTPAAPPDNNNANDEDDEGGGGMMMVVEREHMFDKVVTPSDVGKLNRLVIPKQHAERYFPLDSSTNDKGLLLNFEDRNGKPWRFRYSYWNSSQSYVMTKGWSRFVKDKKLDAGDIVSFQRGVGGSAKDRLFIDWRHRPDAPQFHHPPYHHQFSSPSTNLSFPHLPHHQFSFNRSNIHPWNPLFLQSQPAPSSRTTPHSSNLMLQQPSSYRYGGGPYHNIGTGSVVNVNQAAGGSGSVIYFRSAAGGGGGTGIPHQQQQLQVDMMHQRSGVGIGIGMDPPAPPPPPQQQQPPSAGVVFESVPVVHGKAAAKRLRLFGVNMDCPISDEAADDNNQDYELSPSTTTPTMGMNYHHDYQFPHHQQHYHQATHESSSTIPYLQLRTAYNDQGDQTHHEYHHQTTSSMMMASSSTDHAFNNTTTKSSSSHMSLDLDI